MGKHAYLILAHKNLGQLKTLIKLLDHERNDIFVHIDRRTRINPKEWEGLTDKSELVILDKRQKVHWGGVSIMRAELALLKEATSRGNYDYYHLLSGQDLPIKRQDEIHAFFDNNPGKEFINFWELQPYNVSRFHYYTLFPEWEHPFHTRLINQLGKGIQMAVGYRRNRDIDFRMASQWFSITDSLARYVVAKEDWLEQVFSHTSLCDEIFMATLVWNSPFRDKIYIPSAVETNRTINESNMRYIDWNRGESSRHPWTFREQDFALLMSVPHLWARKFDEKTDPAIIEKITHALR